MPEEKEVALTPEGLRRLEEELEYLKTVKRREVAKRIKVARDFGDLSENSEYDDAKNEQAFVEGRIQQLERLLRNASLIDKVDTGKVSLGSTICLKDLDDGEVVEYTIVGSAEANPDENKISNKSPVGKAVLGKSVGDVVKVNVPAGVLTYQIVSIR